MLISSSSGTLVVINDYRTQHFGDTIGGNKIVKNRTIYNVNMYAHVIPPPELANFSKEQIERHKELFHPEALVTLKTGSADSMIKFGTIIRSVCMIKHEKGFSNATGCIVKLPTGEIAFMTAGHVFKDPDDKKLLEDIKFSQYKLFFGDVDGIGIPDISP